MQLVKIGTDEQTPRDILRDGLPSLRENEAAPHYDVYELSLSDEETLPMTLQEVVASRPFDVGIARMYRPEVTVLRTGEGERLRVRTHCLYNSAPYVISL